MKIGNINIAEFEPIAEEWIDDILHLRAPEYEFRGDRPSSVVSHLYVIECSRRRKIGIASNPQSRFSSIRGSSPNPMRLEFVKPVSSAGVAYAERWAHWQLRDKHVSGEWFLCGAWAAKRAVLEASIRGEAYARAMLENWCDRTVPESLMDAPGKLTIAHLSAEALCKSKAKPGSAHSRRQRAAARATLNQIRREEREQKLPASRRQCLRLK